MKRLRQMWLRCLLSGAGLLVLLLSVGFWWLGSRSIRNSVRDAGGRYRSVELESIANALLHGRNQQVLHYIDFQRSDINDEWLHAHRNSISQLSSLVLFLRDTQVTGDGLSALHGIQAVHFLDLTGTPLSDEDVDHITAIPNVVQLYIGHTGISDSALAGLSAMPYLTFVCIDATQATPTGIAGLKSCPRMTGVMLLDADDASVAQVAQMNGLTNLTLVGEQVTRASLPTFQTLTGLQSLTLYGTNFTEDAIEELQQALPGCIIDQQELETLDEVREAVWSGVED